MSSEAPQSPQGNDRRVEEKVRQRFGEIILRRLKHLKGDEGMEGDDSEPEFVRDLTQRLARYFPEYAEGFAEISGVLGQGPSAGESEVVARELARSTSQLLLSRLTPRQIDERFKGVITNEKGWTFINDLVSYEVNGNMLMLHVAPSFSRSNIEIAGIIHSGAYMLARELESNAALAGVERIRIHSWIVFAYSEPLKKMGWTVENVNTDKEEAEAEMKKAAFLAQYGTKK